MKSKRFRVKLTEKQKDIWRLRNELNTEYHIAGAVCQPDEFVVRQRRLLEKVTTALDYLLNDLLPEAYRHKLDQEVDDEHNDV